MDTLIELIANICVNIFALDTEEYVRGVSNLVNNMFDQVSKMIMYYSDPRMSDIAGDAVFWPAQVERIIEVIEKEFPGHGEEYATKLRDYTIALYKKCAEYAYSKGIIIADTKFEFGLDKDGNVVLGDEMLTPDSSRFWPLDGYKPGQGQPSFDKQFVRDWLKANPDSDYLLPDEVIDKTIAKYKEAYLLLTGKEL